MSNKEAFTEPELEELRRLLTRVQNRNSLNYDQQLRDFVENPIQFSIYKKLGLFSRWFKCHRHVGKLGDGEKGYCKNDSEWITNPYSELAEMLFEKIARDSGIDDGDYAGIDGEEAMRQYFGVHYLEIIKPQFRCEQHIGKLKEIAVKI